MKNSSLVKLVKSLCECATENRADLGITNEEAEELLSELLDENIVIERIRRVKINRKHYRIQPHLKFQKYFETIGHNGIIERICFDNSSKYAFTGGSDGVIKCWSIPDGMLIRSLYGHRNMVSDLCINKDGTLMVSVDYQGTLNVWCLNEFKLLNTIDLNTEAIFCEFIYNNATISENTYTIFIILSNGTVRTITFNRSSMIEQKHNNFMEGESIKSICITDGGRFVICGGWWPFFLVYDTCDLSNVIVMENFKIQALCAAKNALKFAAACENQIFSYTFCSEDLANTGNFNKKRSGFGSWKKSINHIDGEYFVEWICFLPSFLLVAACSDNIIRIYENDRLVISFQAQSGTIYSHPCENIFAVVGTKLSIYQIVSPVEFPSTEMPLKFTKNSSFCEVTNKHDTEIHVDLIYTESIYISLNDCQFSDDGRYFITCDDQGMIRAYSTSKPINIPEQQFFMSDFSPVDNVIEESFNQTFNLYRQPNHDWTKILYEASRNSVSRRCIEIEEYAITSLEKLKMNEIKFKRLYMCSVTTESGQAIQQSSQSDDETYILSEDTVGETQTSNISDSQLSTEQEIPSEFTIRRRQHRRRSNLDIPLEDSTQQNRRLPAFHTVVQSSPNRRRYLIDSDSSPITQVSSRDSVNTRRRRRIIVTSDDDSPFTDEGTASLATTSLEGEFNGRRILRRSLGLLPCNDEGNIQSAERAAVESDQSVKLTENTRKQPAKKNAPSNLRSRSRLSVSVDGHANEATKRNRIRLRRSLLFEDAQSEENESDGGIDGEFENELAAFSHNWLTSCSIFVGCQVYFSLSSYLELMTLDRRISYSKCFPKKSGVYQISSVHYEFVGRIPYISLTLDTKFEVQFYEYPDSKGIMCTTEQKACSAGQEVMYFENSELCHGRIKLSNPMHVIVGDTKILRSMIVIKQKSLNLSPIEFKSDIKLLFGLSRTSEAKKKLIITYTVINTKLRNNLYRNGQELLFDLDYLFRMGRKLGEPFRARSESIYKEYLKKIM